MERSRIVAVVGGGSESDAEVLALAERLGELIAGRGWVLITGGRSGVMEAASRGARRAGGRVLGILPGTSPGDANPHVEIALPTGLGEARNAVIATAADAVVAVGGEYGTLSEIALGLKLGKPVLALASRWSSLPGAWRAASAEAAVRDLAGFLRAGGPDGPEDAAT